MVAEVSDIGNVLLKTLYLLSSTSLKYYNFFGNLLLVTVTDFHTAYMLCYCQHSGVDLVVLKPCP